jgi:hypothetical protein
MTGTFYYHYDTAGVAQLVEQRIRNAKVEGSIPFTGTIAKGSLSKSAP